MHRFVVILMVLIIATSKPTMACNQQNEFKTTTNNTLGCCSLCSPGQYMVKECTAEIGTICKECPAGHFQDKKNNDKACHKCTPVCDGKQREVLSCSSTEDLKCECPPGKFYHVGLAYCKDCSICRDGFVVDRNCTHGNNTICKRMEGFVKTTTLQSSLPESSTPTAVPSISIEPELPLVTKTAQPPVTKAVYIEEPPVYRILAAVFGIILLLLVVALLCIVYKVGWLPSKWHHFPHGTLTSPQGSDVSLLWVGDLTLKLRDIPASVIESLAEILNPPATKNWLYLASCLGFTQQQIANYRLQPTEATQSLLRDWSTMNGATVARLHQELLAMGRSDAAQLLHSSLPSKGTLV